MDGAAERPVVGLLGAFDTGELGEVALRRVIEWELARRRPDIELVALAPFGAERPIPGDEGRPAHAIPPLALTDPGDQGLGVDALIIAGDVLAGDNHWAARYPVAPQDIEGRGIASLVLSGTRGGRPAALSIMWFAVGVPEDGHVGDAALDAGRDVWVRDRSTQELLGGTTVQSGDPLLLAGRVFAPDVLRRRADLLRMCGALPTGRRLVIEEARRPATFAGGEPLIEAIAAALRAEPKLSVVVLALDPTRQSTGPAFRLGGVLAERVHHLPIWAGLDDIAAAMAGSAAVVARSPAGAHLAASLGAPVAALVPGSRDRFDPAIPVLDGDVPAALHALLTGTRTIAIDEAVRTLEGAFAELAERIPRAATTTRAARDPVASALTILQQRLADERTALQAELSRVQSELDHLRSSPEHRIARPIREGYRRWQRRRT